VVGCGDEVIHFQKYKLYKY
jgi:hypothetical protein